MHEIHVDETKKRLYITLGGFSSIDQIEQTTQQVKQAVQQLRSGFDVITDISNYKPANPEVAKAIQAMQLFLKQAGMQRVVRVVSQSVLAGMQFKNLGKEAGYEASVTGSLQEAEQLLDK